MGRTALRLGARWRLKQTCGSKCLTIRAGLPWLILLQLASQSAAQENSAKLIDRFSGQLSVTNNGISLIPSFSLGDPAAILDLSMGRGKFSFEPEMRFALDGKPWSFIFWFRYSALKTKKFSFRIGAHPALNFKTIEIAADDGSTREIISTRRFLAGELSSGYSIGRDTSIGLYYLYARGFEEEVTRNTHFVRFNGSLAIHLTERLSLGIVPQVYYLKADDRDGFYTAAFLTLARRDLPLSLSAIFSRAIETDVIPNEGLVWNVSLVYSFH